MGMVQGSVRWGAAGVGPTAESVQGSTGHEASPPSVSHTGTTRGGGRHGRLELESVVKSFFGKRRLGEVPGRSGKFCRGSSRTGRSLTRGLKKFNANCILTHFWWPR